MNPIIVWWGLHTKPMPGNDAEALVLLLVLLASVNIITVCGWLSARRSHIAIDKWFYAMINILVLGMGGALALASYNPFALSVLWLTVGFISLLVLTLAALITCVMKLTTMED